MLVMKIVIRVMNENNCDFLLLTSPPASGKTFWISQFTQNLTFSEVLVVSPLRALADECRAIFGNKVKIETPESWMQNKTYSAIVIFDEFHLLFHWGNSFRPIMWEAFYDLSVSSELIIGLTATSSDEMKVYLESFQAHFRQMIWCDHGNMQLKFPPRSYIRLPSKKFMMQVIFLEEKFQGTSLIFCQYRDEVLEVTQKLLALNYSVWSCVGGGAQNYIKLTKDAKSPDFIVCTTVLSHGVNLPDITRVYFLYQVQCQDFWVQMVARGGRRGQDYHVFALENPFRISFSLWRNSLAILVLSFRMKWNQFSRQFFEWFLKESSHIKSSIKKEIS
jgi:superfamily II DNA or RNA helicase